MSSHSGKFVLRVSPFLHQRLAEKAQQQHVSLNQVCVSMLQESLSEKSKTVLPPWQKPAEEILKQMKKKFREDLLGLVVFGSQVRGDATKHSDLDLLVVLDENVPIKRGLYAWWDSVVTWKGNIKEINPHFVHLSPSPQQATGLWYEIAMFHKIIFEKGKQISVFIEELILSMEQGKISRSVSNGHPYWIKEDYINRAGHRLKALEVLMEQKSFADVVREAQEIVELCLKSLLRKSGIEVPRLHDVSDILKKESHQLPKDIKPMAAKLAEISKKMRRDRELSFYGTEDLTPGEFYEEADARQALAEAKQVHAICKQAF